MAAVNSALQRNAVGDATIKHGHTINLHHRADVRQAACGASKGENAVFALLIREVIGLARQAVGCYNLVGGRICKIGIVIVRIDFARQRVVKEIHIENATLLAPVFESHVRAGVHDVERRFSGTLALATHVGEAVACTRRNTYAIGQVNLCVKHVV